MPWLRRRRGEIIDPYGGRRDLEARLLRHVSDAFVEDPVRILRVARFAARYADLGFRVAEDTLVLMERMTATGEVDALVPERVWKETERALGESRPDVFETLRSCGARRRSSRRSTPSTEFRSRRAGTRRSIRGCTSCWLCDIPRRLERPPWCVSRGSCTIWVRRCRLRRGGRATMGMRRRVSLSSSICATASRSRTSIAARDTHGSTPRTGPSCRRGPSPDVAEAVGNGRCLPPPERFGELLLACESDARGRAGLESQPYPQREYLLRVRDAAAAVSLTEEERSELKGPFLGERIRTKRLAAVTAVKDSSCPPERPSK